MRSAVESSLPVFDDGEKGQRITNQYASINEPLDVIMGGSGAMLQIVHTLVASLSRLDGAVETLFLRLDGLEESVSTLTYNIQGFEPTKFNVRASHFLFYFSLIIFSLYLSIANMRVHQNFI